MKNSTPRFPDKSAYTEKDVEIIEQKNVFQGFFNMVMYTVKHRLFAGGWSKPQTREIFERGHAAALIPYDPTNDSVVLIEQFRVGALVGGCSPWQFEIVAGIIDKNETAVDVVRRECQEEAGINVNCITHVIKYLASAGGSSETIDIFVGQVDSTQADGIHGLDEEGEDIRVHVFSRDVAYQLIHSGRIENAAAIIALQWLQLNYKKLKKEWAR